MFSPFSNYRRIKKNQNDITKTGFCSMMEYDGVFDVADYPFGGGFGATSNQDFGLLIPFKSNIHKISINSKNSIEQYDFELSVEIYNMNKKLLASKIVIVKNSLTIDNIDIVVNEPCLITYKISRITNNNIVDCKYRVFLYYSSLEEL